MKIDHIGYAVKDIDKARKRFEFLGFIFEKVIKDETRNLFIQFGIKDGYRIELVSPICNGSPVDGILSTAGAGPYHICYSSSDVQADIKRLEEDKYKVIVPLAKAVAFDNRRVVFMMNRNIGIIEIVENISK